MNKVILIGRLGKDPEQRIAGEKVAVSFTMATTEKWKTGERTEWHNMTCWDGPAKFIMDYCKKGDLVAVEGDIRYESYDKDGEKKYITKIYIQKLDKLSTKADSEGKPSAKASPTGKKPVIADDEIPF